MERGWARFLGVGVPSHLNPRGMSGPFEHEWGHSGAFGTPGGLQSPNRTPKPEGVWA